MTTAEKNLPNIKRLRAVCAAMTISISAFLASSLDAQTVRVDSGPEVGHGLMIRHQETCYLITARHVVDGRPIASVRSAVPVELGTATMQTPFWTGMDLAVGVLRGSIEGRCTLTLDRISGDLAAESVSVPELVRLRDSGEVERVLMRIVTTSYLTFSGEVLRAEDSLFRGSSGAFAMSGERPLGMIINTSPDGLTGEFIRIEEIEPNLRRWITRRVGLDTAATTLSSPRAPSVGNETGIDVRLESATRAPIGSDFVPENLLGPGSYIFEPGLNRIEFRVAGADAVALSRVVMETAADAGHAMPNEVQIEISSNPTGGNWRRFSQGAMAPDGILDLRRSSQLARWIAVTVVSARAEGPIRIDNIRFE